MAVELKSGAGADIATVDTASKALRVSIYDTSGSSVSPNVEPISGGTKTVIYGLTEGGSTALPISASGEGHLEVSIQEPKAVFGEIVTAALTPVVQVDFVYGLNTNLVTTAVTGSGTATSSNQMGVASTTAAATSSAQIRSYRVAKYRPGQGVECRFTAIFTTGAANSTQIAGPANADIDGYFVGYSGSSFGVMYRRNSVDTWVTQSSFNVDKLDGTGASGFTIDPTKLNIFRVQIGYLGVFGAIISVMNPANNQWVEVHWFSGINARTTPIVINPTMSMLWEARNTTNATNIVVSGGSGSLFIQGLRARLGGTYSAQNNKSVATTQTNIVTIRNNTTINSTTNRSLLRIRQISCSTAASVPVVVIATKNTTLGGAPSYTNIDATNSLAAYDTAGTTLTGGTAVYNLSIGPTGSQTVDVSEYDIFLLPGETLTLSAAVISGGAASHLVSVNWSEDV